MKVLIDLPEKVLKSLEKKANDLNRSRKNYIELVLKMEAYPDTPAAIKKQSNKTKKHE